MKDNLIDITQNIDYETFKNQGTGSPVSDREILKQIPFERFIITIKVSPANEFIGIESIEVNKDFLSFAEKLASLSTLGYHDVEEFYEKIEPE